MEIDKLKNVIQACNLNFLVGSGLSVPYFSTLGNIEVLLTDLSRSTSLTSKESEIIRASILGKYFETVIRKNPFIIDDLKLGPNKTKVLNNYKQFLLALNTIILKRKSTILNKQVNLFTTNIDVFLEKAIEQTQVEYNDGFYGRFNPIFSLTNFKKSLFKKSLHYDNKSEIPIFNLLKVHGSLTWKKIKESVYYSDLSELKAIQDKYDLVKSDLIDFDPSFKIRDFEKEVKGITHSSLYSDFIEKYNDLAIVNPTKQKLHDTILNLTYYELLRVLSNELERENTVLFVMGFSMSDEHIREIVLRAANSNPTLVILIFAYDSAAKDVIEENIEKVNSSIRYQNIQVLEPEAGKHYDFKTINESVFLEILNQID